MREREFRNMEMRIAPSDEGKSYRVEGYASTFEPYEMFRVDDIVYSEKIDPHAFDEADMSDVVLRVDHSGPVYARTSAGSIELFVDEHGLGHHTDLSRTSNSRALFEDIEAGNYPKMSFAFVVAEDGDEFDKKTHTRIIHRVAKVFDISPVSFPANPGTELSVSTRDYFNGVIEMEKAERLEEEKRNRQKQKIKTLLEVI